MSLSRVLPAGMLLLTSASASLGQPSFRGLGDLPGPTFAGSQAIGVSPDGHAVVGVARSPYPDYEAYGTEAFLWTRAEGMIGLGGLPWPFDGGSLAYGASNDGEIVVGISRFNDTMPLYSYRAVRWSGEEIIRLGVKFSSRAYAVTPDGAYIVGCDSSVATRWGPDGTLALGMLPGDFESEATGVSADASVAVGWSRAYGGGLYPFRAFRWSESGGMVSLGDFPGGFRVDRSRANAVSADGAVVVGYGSSVRGVEAFRWTAESGLVALGDLPGGEFNSVALAVSGDGGTVVGQATTGITGTEAFVWDAHHGMRILRAVLELEHGLDLAGWQLQRAGGISADGMVIAGAGVNPGGRPEAWVADLRPCPADWNADRMIDSRDFFEFLADFFAGDADFDADGSTTSADFFAFVTAWLTGC